MQQVTTYNGVTIYEDYGYYTSSLDPTVESRKMEDIVSFIDEVLGLNIDEGFKVDIYIVTECIVHSEFWDN